MGLFNDYMREGKGVDKGPDFRPRFIVFFDIYLRKFWNLILLNLLYIICCIPIVTIGPATAAMTKILRNYARKEHAFLWSDFWETFKKNFWPAFAVGIIDIVAVLLIYFDYVIYMQMIANANGSQMMTSISLAVLLLSATMLLFMNYYIYVLMVTFKLKFTQLIKNSFIFAWAGFFRNILITLLIAIISFLCLITVISMSPASLIVAIFVIFLYFSTCGFICNFITYPLVKKYMIDGFDPETGEKLDK